jgi:hypothetical protein
MLRAAGVPSLVRGQAYKKQHFVVHYGSRLIGGQDMPAEVAPCSSGYLFSTRACNDRSVYSADDVNEDVRIR